MDVSSENELAAAEQHVREGEEKIARVKARIAELKASSADTSQASDLLRALEAAQAQAVDDRNTVFREVAGNDC